MRPVVGRLVFYGQIIEEGDIWCAYQLEHTVAATHKLPALLYCIVQNKQSWRTHHVILAQTRIHRRVVLCLCLSMRREEGILSIYRRVVCKCVWVGCMCQRGFNRFYGLCLCVCVCMFEKPTQYSLKRSPLSDEFIGWTRVAKGSSDGFVERDLWNLAMQDSDIRIKSVVISTGNHLISRGNICVALI